MLWCVCVREIAREREGGREGGREGRERMRKCNGCVLLYTVRKACSRKP